MKTLLCFLLFLVANAVHAQTDVPPYNFKTAITWNPLTLLATDRIALLGVEHRVTPQLAVTLDAGYIFDSYYINKSIARQTSGFALRPAVKWYGKKHPHEFLQLQLAYKRVDYTLEDWVDKNCVGDVPAYMQFQRFTYRKDVVSLNFAAGESIRLSNRLLLQVDAGLGIKFKNQRSIEPESCYRMRSGLLNFFRPKYTTINAPVSVKFFVALN